MEESRAATLKRQQRRVYAWSMTAAVFVHVLAIGYIAWPRIQVMWGGGVATAQGEADPGGTPVRVFFQSPVIQTADSSLLPQGRNRGLSAERRLTLGPECLTGHPDDGDGASGEVFLKVNLAGRVDSVLVTRTSGSACWDRAIASLASDLWYQWLPNEDFPPPVRLFQPVTVTLAGY